MAEPPNNPQPGIPPQTASPGNPPATPQERVFLVVVDDSDEMRVALRYAARRAQHTGGRVALLYVIEPTELQQWMAVETLMREEQREQAEALLQKLSAQVLEMAGTMPILYIREGRRREELMGLLDEEPSISILVLAASASSEGPGPLITALAGKFNSRLRIPMTIVPGNLTNEQIDALS